MKHVAEAVVVAFGFEKAIEGVKSLVDAAEKAQVSQTRLETAFKNVGISSEKAAAQVEMAEKAGRKLGFMNTETKDSLGSLVTSTGSVSKSMRELSISQDLARFKGVDLTTATKALTMANAGSMRAIKQLGITIVPVTNAVDALKASHMKLTTEQGKQALDAAKLIDKQATIAKVMDVVQGKVLGQADAFSKTGAGAMATFHANVDALQESLGARLLPALTAVAQYINDNWPKISAVITAVTNAIQTGIGAAVSFVQSHWSQISNVFNQVKGVVVSAVMSMVNVIRSNWPQIVRVATDVFNDLKAIVQGTITVIKAYWDQFGGAIKTIARNTWEQVKGIVQAALNVIRGVVNIIGGLLKGDWSRVWQGIKQLTSGLVGGVVATIRGMVGNFLAAAKAVGAAILNGVTSVLGTIGAKVANAFTSLYSALTSAALNAGRDAISIGTGIVAGIVNGLGGLISTVANAIKDKVEGAIKTAWNWLTGSPHVTAAIPIGYGIVYGVIKGLDEYAAQLRKAIVDKIKKQIETAKGDLASAFSSLSGAATSAFDAVHGGNTEKGTADSDALAKMQAEDQVKADNDALAAAIASGDQGQIDAATRTIKEHQLQQEIQAEQEKHDALVKKQKDDFEKRLAELQAQAGSAKTEAQVQAIQAKIKALLKKYGITPASVEASADWNASQTLFVNALGDLKKSMDELVNALSALRSTAGGGLPKKATGGYLSGGAHEGIPIMAHGGEFVIRKRAVDKLGMGFLSQLNSYDGGGPVDPETGVPFEIPLTSAVGSGAAYEIWRRKHMMDKIAKKEARILASRALYNPARLPTPASAADSVIDSWLSALSTDALFTERLGALKMAVDSGDLYRGGAVTRDYLTYGVPKLKTGGTLLSDGLFYGHRGERVTPARATHGGGMGDIKIYLDGREITSVVESRLVAQGRRGGPYPAREAL